MTKENNIHKHILYLVVSAVLIIPAAIPYYQHYTAADDGRIATGFIANSQPIYMSHAREYFDDGFSLLHSNPCTYDYNGPKIYFPISLFVLGLFWKLTGLSLGTAYVFFGFICAIICARLAVALYKHIIGLDKFSKWIGLVVFFWGGGILAISGIIASGGSFERIFRFDPGSMGWWCLNFGRIFIYPNEAIYHMLFLAAVVTALKKRFWLSAALVLITCFSHPFTGAELLPILILWALLEIFFIKSKEIPLRYLISIVVIMVLYFGYYAFFLNLFPEHREISEAVRLNWSYTAINFVPAYLLVGLLAMFGIRNLECAKEFFSKSYNRLFAVWFVVAFMLANHEFATKNPMQPIHFTRGYVWMGLFLMGVPSLVMIFDKLLALKVKILGITLALLLFVIMVFDNALWLSPVQVDSTHSATREFRYLTPSMQELFDWMNNKDNRKRVVVAEHLYTSKFIPTYTPLRSWWSHVYNTPSPKQRKAEIETFFSKGKTVQAWNDMPLLIVASSNQSLNNISEWLKQEKAKKVFQNMHYIVFKVN